MSLNKSLLTLITEDLEKKKKPSKPKVPRNQWQHPGEVTTIPGNNITMDGVSYPVLGVPNVGPPQMMYPDQQYHFPGAGNVTEYPEMANGGYTVTRSSDRKGKTHKVTGPGGVVKYFGDSSMGQHPRDPERKKAFYARHKKNLDGNPFFRAFARATWQDGGQQDEAWRAAIAQGTDKVLAAGLKGAKWIGKNVFGTDDIVPDVVKDYMFNTVRPVSYPTDMRQVVAEFIRSDKAKPTRDLQGDLSMDEEAWSRVLRRPTKSKYFVPSKYKPSNAKDPSAEYYTLSPDVFDGERMKRIIDDHYFNRNKRVNKAGQEYVPMQTMEPFMRKQFMKDYKKYAQMDFDQTDPLANFQIYRGVDPKTKKKYLSISDTYDFGMESANEVIKPMNIYDRFYYAGGGQTRNEREMVNGIADILSQVNDPQNRAQIAQQMIKDFKDEDVTFDYEKFMQMSKLKNGGMIKRADGSYSKRGLWDNIRANRGSGKKPTKEMLEQERKIKANEKKYGGGTDNPGFDALPPYVQAKILSNMANGGQMPAEIARARFAAAGNLDKMDDYGYAKGGSTYSGGVWFDEGGIPMMQFAGPTPVNPKLMNFILPQLQQMAPAGQMPQPIQPTSPVANYKPADVAPTYSLDDMNADIPAGGIINPNTGVAAADAMINQQFQQQAANTYAKPVGNMPKPKPDMNNFNKGLMKAQDKMMSDWADPYSLEGMTGLANNIVEGINNRKDLNANLQKRRYNYSTDGMYNENQPSAMNRGQYDMYGTMAPANQSGMMSFTGMNQKYTANRRFDIGGSPYESMATSWIPGDVKVPDVPFLVKAPTAPMGSDPRAMTTAPAADEVTRVNFNLDGNFEKYAQDAQSYLNKKAPGTPLKGVDLAAAAQAAYKKNGTLVPVELALAQLQIEGFLAKGNKPNKPQRTNNPFNVGNVDDGRVVNHNSIQSGINAYYELMSRSYLKDKTPEQLLQNFVNKSGNRYASDKSYERKLRSTIGNMQFAYGGEVELTQDEIDEILRNGGEVEYI